jgi:hypothetical protein
MASLGSVGVFIALVFLGLRNGEERESVEEARMAPASPESAVTVPSAAPPDPRVSLLGTDSSLSTQEQQLVLVATAPGRQPNQGIARLGTDPRNPQTYSAGARLANGAVLQEIYADYVILSRDGKQSLLLIAGKAARVGKRHEDIGVDSSVLAIGGEEAVNRPLERIASSREDLSEIIRAEPYFERDEYAGLKILPGTHGGRLAQLELQSGDIVRTIEGRRKKSADAAWQALDDAISTGTPIVVGIERDGTMMSLSIDGSRLASNSMQQTLPPPGS